MMLTANYSCRKFSDEVEGVKDSANKTEITEIKFFPNIDHIGIIVHQADKEAENLEQRFGAKIIHRQTIRFDQVIYKGDTLSYEAYFVFADLGNMKIEYIQPDLNTPSPYLDILNEKGAHAHHLCFLVESLEEYVAKVRKDNPGFKIIAEVWAKPGKGGAMIYAEGVIPGTLVELATLLE